MEEAARIVTDALLDDPGWVAVGPSNRGHRRRVELGFHRAALDIARRYGGPIYGAYRDGRLIGVAVTFGAGRHPPPSHTFFKFVPPFLLAGPGPIVRGLRASRVQERGHPQEEHVFLWLLAVDPASQRSGAGRALIARVAEDAAAPVYLDTSNPANVPYYASAGFEEIGRGVLPRNTDMWFMLKRS